jgi:hypothetical protein
MTPLDDLIVVAYGLSNGLRLLSYAPQIWCVSRDNTGAQAISCLSWNLWAAANLTTALYAWTQLQDLALTVVNGANALCCLAVVLITCAKRDRLRSTVRGKCTSSMSPSVASPRTNEPQSS